MIVHTRVLFPSCMAGCSALLLQPGVPSVLQLPYRLLNNKIYVGGLAESSTEESIQQFYSQFGTIKAFKPVREANMRHSLKHVFVSFSSKKELDTAISQLPHLIDGSPVWVFPLPEVLTKQQQQQEQQQMTVQQPEKQLARPSNYGPHYELCISNLPPKCSPQSILDFYTRFDPKVRVRVNENKTSIVMFSSVEGLIKSVAHPYHEINGHRVKVSPSKYTVRHRLHVSDLTSKHTQIALHQHFSQFGSLLECSWSPVSHNPKSMCKYAFIGYATQEEMEKALAHPSHQINDSTVKVTKLAQGHEKETMVTELEDLRQDQK